MSTLGSVVVIIPGRFTVGLVVVKRIAWITSSPSQNASGEDASRENATGSFTRRSRRRRRKATCRGSVVVFFFAKQLTRLPRRVPLIWPVLLLSMWHWHGHWVRAGNRLSVLVIATSTWHHAKPIPWEGYTLFVKKPLFYLSILPRDVIQSMRRCYRHRHVHKRKHIDLKVAWMVFRAFSVR
jgi:hypothetical protein